MSRRSRYSVALAMSALAAGASPVLAEEYRAETTAEYWDLGALPALGFVEVTGSYGFQFGETEFLPDGEGEFRHPLVHGYALGATGGAVLTPGIAVIANYEYTRARSRTGEIPLIIDRIRGRVSYHTAVAGVRIWRRVGITRLRAELAAGLMFPHEKRATVEYGPALAAIPDPITGTGRRVREFGIGYGGHGLLGVEVPLGMGLYLAGSLKVKAFQADNDGEQTRLENFVVDLAVEEPVAVTAVIPHGDRAAPPTTSSVQDVRLQFAIGTTF
jgi:hypothetical protein